MREILVQCRSFIIYTGIFSFFINLLMLTPIIFMINALDRVLSSRSLETLFMLAIIAIFAMLIEAFLENIRGKLLGRFSLTLQGLLGVSALIKILKIKQKDVQTRYGMDDVNTLQEFITTKAVKALFDLPWIPFYIFILYLFHPLLALMAIIFLVILVILAYWEYKTTHHNQLQVGAYGLGGKNFLDLSFSNNEIINALSMQSRITQRWWLINEDYLNRKNQVEHKVAFIQSITTFVGSSRMIFSLSLGAYLVIMGDASAGIMIAANILMGRAIAPIGSVIAAGKSLITAKEAYKRLDTLLQKKSTIEQLTLPKPIGKLSVEKVFFFLNSDRNILNGVDFQIEAGETLAIIGSSGSGKTSLARLLVGYYKPVSGFVRLDSADISQWSDNGLGELIGYLPQDIQLFNGSISDNIARLESIKDNEEKIIEAAKQAGIHEMILRMSDGYDTDIGEKGNKLSGGQRQRVGLARALYGDPNYLVLDEPNSHMDGEAEIELIELIGRLKKQGTTIVVITHKPNLVEVADKLLVLHEGNVVQFGSRTEVLEHIKLV